MRRRRLILVLVALVGAAALYLVRYNTTSSMPRGLYLRLAWIRSRPARGDIVLACAPPAAAELALQRRYLHSGPCPAGALGRAALLGKIVVAVAGDRISVSEGGLTLNGRTLSNSKPLLRDSAGRKLEPYPAGTYEVAPDEVWLFSPYNPRSFDSRYFGPVLVSAVEAKLVPLLIEPDRRFHGYAIRPFQGSIGEN